ncbi:hemagglutinin repeat-containing protein [Saccharospirillum sp. HFRX-1]|uniref:two-partner secretion domain-containing protein n=1 Tax=unclassified Saccharospirillum TaxID=2633430 RepID=UPI0037115650
MNKRCFRVIFNAVRGQLMVAGELAGSGDRAANGASVPPLQSSPLRLFGLLTRAVGKGLVVLIGGLTMVQADTQITADSNASNAHQATVTESASGVTQVNITKPSAGGVSRNVYSQFDVGGDGAILNNSKNSVQTELAGWVEGNANLSQGTASIILNEINSDDPSYLQGYIEIAGRRAELIIANPSGIQVDGAGFINASSATLTTGRPVMLGGHLDHYRVTGGTIGINGDGLDGQQTDYTRLIARAVDVNAGIWAQDLSVIAGANKVNASSLDASQLTLDDDTDAPVGASIDVASLGGMYAGKIFLVGTEDGVGIHNHGTLAATSGNVVITEDGQLLNAGIIQAEQGDVDLTAETLTNSGDITAEDALIAHTETLDNRDGNLQTNRFDIETDTLINANGTLQQLGSRELDLELAELDNRNGWLGQLEQESDDDIDLDVPDDIDAPTDGNSGEPAAPVDSADETSAEKPLAGRIQVNNLANNQDGTISSAGLMNLAAESINNQTGELQLNSLSMDGSSLNNSDGLIDTRSADLTLENWNNRNGQLSAGSLIAQLDALNNDAGDIQGENDLTFTFTGSFSNNGTINAGRTELTVADTLTNRGLIDGDLTYIDAGTLTNIGSGRIYGDHIGLQAEQLNNFAETTDGTTQTGTIAARERLDIGATNVDNADGSTLVSLGELSIGGSLDENYMATGSAEYVLNRSATIESYGDMFLNADRLVNRDDHLQYKIVLDDSYHEHVDINSTDYRDYTVNVYGAEVTSKTQGVIRSGSDINIASADARNIDSHIVAGETLDVEGTTLRNIATEVGVTTTHNGIYRYKERYWKCWGPADIYCERRTRYPTKTYKKTFNRTVDLAAFREEQNATVDLTSSVDARTQAEGLGDAPSLAQLTTSGLFQIMPNTSSGYLIQTDPAFANYGDWLNSDFMLQALGFSEGEAPVRLGDGFYEQQLIKEQIIAQTGQRYLGDNTDDNTQYQNLMTAGVTFAQEQELRPGIALTAAQVEALTTDIVWLVEQEVTLADGQVTTALVPKVYTIVREGDLEASGALLAGRNINIDVDGDFTNTGTVQATETAKVDADNINHEGGAITGEQVQLSADEDINVIGASVKAEDLLALNAGNDLNVTTTTAQGRGVYEQSVRNNVNWFSNTSTTQQVGESTSQVIDQYASLSVTNGTGKIIATAGNDINLTGAQLDSAGDVYLDAENDLNLNTVTESSSDNIKAGRTTIANEERHDVGTQITGGGNITMLAGNDIAATAANVEAGEGLTVQAEEGGVEILAGVDYSSSSKKTSWSGGLFGGGGSNSTESRSTTAVGSSFSAGDGNLVIQANDTVTVQASELSASETLQIAAADIEITAAVNESYNRQTSEREGTFKKKSKDEGSIEQTAASSSLSGNNIQLQADNTVHITASNLDAENNLMIGNLEVEQNDDGSFSAVNGEGTPDQLIVDSLALTNEDWKHETEEWTGIAKVAAGYVAYVGSYIDDDFEVTLSKSSGERNTSTTQQGSSLEAGGNLILAAEEQVDIVASDITTEGTAIVSADNVNVLSAEETHVSETSESETTIAGVGMSYDKDSAELTVGGLEYTDTTVTETQTSTTHKGSNINAGNLIMLADEDINILASTLNVENQAVLQAEEDIVVGGHQATMTNETDTETEVTTVTVGARNAYADSYKAGEALVAATENVGKAYRALERAEERVKNGELDEAALEDYKLNHAAAVAAAVQAQIALTASVAGVATTGGTGFYANLNVETTNSSSHSESTQNTWQGSSINAGSLSVSSENATFEGSNIAAGLASLNSTNTLITAGVNSSSSSSESSSVTASATVKLGGGGASGSVGVNSSESENSSTQYVNSRFNVGTLTSNSENLTLRGAEVSAQTAQLDVGNLTIESLQDTHNSTNSSKGVNVGFSDTNPLSSLGANTGEGEGSGKQVSNQSHLLIADGENSQVTADSTTLVGGMIANASFNEEGVLEDHGNLNLVTGELNVSSLEDSSHSSQTGFGLTMNFSNNSAEAGEGSDSGGWKPSSGTINASRSGHEMEGSTQATLGGGNIQVGGVALDDSNAPEGLNRDVADAQITTLDIDTGGLNASLMVDGQYLTEAGRDRILRNQLAFAGNTLKAGTGAFTDVAAITAATVGGAGDLLQGRGLGQMDDAFNATINSKRLASDNEGKTAGMTEAMRDGDIEDAQAMQDAINDIDAVINGGDGDRVRVVEGVVNKEGNGVHGAAEIGGDAMYVGIGDDSINSVVNTVTHEGMHLAGAEEINAHTTGFLADMSYRLNAFANRDQINENRPAPIAVQDPAANAQLLAANNTLFRMADDRGELNYSDFTGAEAGLLDETRLAIHNNPFITPAMRSALLEKVNEQACAAVHCSAGVSENDPHYEQLKAMEDAGNASLRDGLNIQRTLETFEVESNPDEDNFEYGLLDRGNDFIYSNEVAVSVIVNAKEVTDNALIYTVGAATELVGSVCDDCETVRGFGQGLQDSALNGLQDNAEALLGDHNYLAGDQVLKTLSLETHTEEFNPTADLTRVAVETGTEMALGFGAGKVLTVGAKVVRRADDVVDAASDLPASAINNVSTSRAVTKGSDESVDNSIVADGPFSYLPGNHADGVDYVGPYTRFDTTSTDTLYRVDTNPYPPRISSDGTIPEVINRDGSERALFINIGQPERAKEFALVNRNGNATVTAVEVNSSLADRLRSTAVYDRAATGNNVTSPLQVDIKASDQFGLRDSEQIQWLRDAMDPSTVRIVDPNDL